MVFFVFFCHLRGKCHMFVCHYTGDNHRLWNILNEASFMPMKEQMMKFPEHRNDAQFRAGNASMKEEEKSIF